MKTTIIHFSILTLLSVSSLKAQDKTTVTAANSEISDNLDLRAVASLFGDSENLADFEQRLNDPKTQISNLDLNEDNQVDYLRVIETIEGNAHIIVIQSVLGKDTFQDVATVEVQRDVNNRVQVQVVGDVYMYGANYIYEPIYVNTPLIYTSFWVGNYHPYYSSWYWGYFPTYYYAWEPFPVFRYRSRIGYCINNHYQYNYVTYRRCEGAYNSYRGRRSNGYESRYPNRSFQARRGEYANRYELDKTRNIRTVGTRGDQHATPDRVSPRVSGGLRNESPRASGSIRNESSRAMIPRPNSTPRAESPSTEAPRSNTPRPRTMATQGGNVRNPETPRSSSSRENSTPRNNSSTSGRRASGGGNRRG
jgi:hypothetical protein